ncbi:MAG: PspC domain-containing protein [Actinomycetia bacterium]|nr:PspC domain-containing protein [Actinomycetes bacterium]
MAGNLTRSSNDKIISGVCGGIAAYLNADPTLVRVVAVLLVAFTGFGPLLYLVLWAILPEQDTGVRGIDMVRDEATRLKQQYDQSHQNGKEYMPNSDDLR